MNEQQKLRAERTRLEGEVKALHAGAENRAWTPEEEAKVNAIESQIQNIDFRLMAIEEAMDMPAEQPEESSIEKNGLEEKIQAEVRKAIDSLAVSRRRIMPAPMVVSDLDDKRAERERGLALRAWFLGNDANAEEVGAARKLGLNLRNNKLTLRAQSTTTTAGGYTIPQGFLAELESRRLFYNTLRGVARVIRTETGNTLPFPTTDDTSNVANLTAENTAPSATDVVFGQVSLGAYKLDSLVQVSNELLRDSGLDLASEIASILGERIGRKEAAFFATGTGSSQPQGVVTGASAGATAATTTTITLANIMSLVNSLDFAYQQGASFMMHQSVWNTILQLADSQNRPLFLDLLNGNGPRLLGYPVVVNNNMASSIASAAITMLFGDFSKYYIRQAGDLEVIRMDERYADAYQTGFMVVERVDAKVAQSNAIKKLTQPTATTTTT